jgi:hypothetical protein
MFTDCWVYREQEYAHRSAGALQPVVMNSLESRFKPAPKQKLKNPLNKVNGSEDLINQHDALKKEAYEQAIAQTYIRGN